MNNKIKDDITGLIYFETPIKTDIMSELTKAEKILELHLGSEFYRLKESEFYRNIKNAINEALNMPVVIVPKGDGLRLLLWKYG